MLARLGGFARYAACPADAQRARAQVGYRPTVEPLWFCKERSAYHQDDSQRAVAAFHSAPV